MKFKEMLLLAKQGEKYAANKLLEMYRPLLMKESIIDGIYDEDLYQELCLVLLHCIDIIKI